MTGTEELGQLRVPMDEQTRAAWIEFGVKEVFLNDVAAAALIEVPVSWLDPKEAADLVARGLRGLSQHLWRLDLVRPVLAVFWPSNGTQPEVIQRLDRLSWDDELHRGDFALRRAHDEQGARALLWLLLSDSVQALDDGVREAKVGEQDAREALQRLPVSDKPNEAEAQERLVAALIGALDAGHRGGRNPDFKRVLEAWLEAEGVGR
jgi:hypothetical protein